jgi:hypothetical protein
MLQAKTRQVNGIKMLEILVPVNQTPAPSASGKTLVVASSHGNKATSVIVNGSPVVVGVNAYIPNPDKPATAAK